MARKKANPMKQKPAATDTAAPVAEKNTSPGVTAPTEEKSAPVEEKAAPAAETAKASQKEPAPAKETAPTEKKDAPVEEKAAPAAEPAKAP